MTDQYGVVGHPIAHSKSPQIHSAFAEQSGEDLQYQALEAPIDGFVETVQRFFRDGAEDPGKGLNVTVPFKLEAYALSQVLSRRAEQAGSVNTLMLGKDEKIYGDNTDGVGLVRDIVNNQSGEVAGQRVLILGAGGAVRGVLGPLLAQTPAQLVIANRTVEKAEMLAERFADQGDIKAAGFSDLAGETFDLVINGTAASLGGELPPLPDGLFAANAMSYDMMYGAEDTVFNRWARQQGVTRCVDGLGMLVEQAAESFFIWRGVRPQTALVMDSLRAQLVSAL